MPETLETQFVRDQMDMLSEIRLLCSLATVPPPGRSQTSHLSCPSCPSQPSQPSHPSCPSRPCRPSRPSQPSRPSVCALFRQKIKYKEEGKKEMSVNLYGLVPDTLDIQHAKEAAELQSEVGWSHSQTDSGPFRSL